MKVDLTVTISVILGCAAVISPILTALINNRHHKRMRLLELKQEKYKETVVYQRNIIESYLQKTAKCIEGQTYDFISEYAEYFGLVSLYLPENIRESVVAIDKSIGEYNWKDAHDSFVKLFPELTAIVQKL